MDMIEIDEAARETMAPTALQALLNNEGAMVAAAQRIATLKKALDEARANHEGLAKIEPQAPALRERAVKLRADVLAGDADPAEARELSGKIRDFERSDAERAAVISHAAAVAEELGNRHAAATGELERLRKTGVELAYAALMDRAQEMGAEYLAAVNRLEELYLRLAGMAALLAEAGGRERSIMKPGDPIGFDVPAFDLASTDDRVSIVGGQMGDSSMGVTVAPAARMLRRANLPSKHREAAERLIDELRGQGWPL